MKKIYFAWLLLAGIVGRGQVVINELDTDTPGTDDKEFIELKSDTPDFSLNGYFLVLFNGTGSNANKSYYVIDLSGIVTDLNGIAVVGNELVSPVPQLTFSNSVIQNGPDGVGLYYLTTGTFPFNGTATTDNLVDALVYDTSDADVPALMSLLGVSQQIDENGNALGTTQSIQRKPDGTYEVKAPTPGANNDGSGFIYNGVRINLSSQTYNEGDAFPVTFTTQTPVGSDLTFTFSLNNGTFDNADYTAAPSVTITSGTTSATAMVTLTDDSLDEGDELAKITFGALPDGYNMLNNNVDVRVIDNDYTIQPWGTPLSPTYGIVASTAPAGYYDSLAGKSGAQLKQAIQDIIANPSVVHAQNYGDVQYILDDADQNPQNSNQVWLMYVEQPRAKYKFQSTSSNVGSWNREHIFPQSRGGFADATSNVADGIDIWAPTNADDIAAGHGDAHHIRAEDGPENTSRSNRDYGSDYNGPAGSQGSWHGDVARALFYMACRYNALSLVNGNPPDTTVGQMGDLSYLLTWNQQDPADDFEMHRNNVVYVWQQNRNPFIDHPDLADYIWGVHAGEAWFPSLGLAQQQELQVGIYPNPASGELNFIGLPTDARVTVSDVSGQRLMEMGVSGGRARLDLRSGMYFLTIRSGEGTAVKKLIVQ